VSGRFRERPLFRIFSADKVVESRLLNALGAQVLRAVAARSLYASRRVRPTAAVSTKLEELRRTGIGIWPDFLPRSNFDDLRRECWELVDTQRESFTARRSGSNTDARVRVRDIDRHLVPNLLRFLAEPRLNEMLEAAEKRPLGDLSAIARIEHLTQGPADGSEDSQTRLHSDIFFSSHKVWFYLSDVEEADGPLVFVERSHRLAPRQLCYLYYDSWTRSEDSDPSRRVQPREVEGRGFRESVFTCPKNTLVVANTCGYHRRLQGEAGRDRLSIHLELRANPFARVPARNG
jgi:Phytanoyl-CoA dioxygenase (PhyH)